MRETTQSICRLCGNFCAIEVETKGGRVIGVTGARDNPLYRGYTCVKGRGQVALYGNPERVLRSLERQPDGSFTPIPTDDAIGEIAARLTRIIDEFGPRAVALFGGTLMAFESPANLAMVDAFMKALGSPMLFTTSTIDQSGKPVAKGFHGAWMAPGTAFSEPMVALLVGNNPFVSHQGQNGPPADFFRALAARGGHAIVIDPRRTETAKRATIHLQPRPGEDAAILAGMIRVIIGEELYDRDFLADNVDGLEPLRQTVAPFTPDYVARRADIRAADLVEAARIFGRAGRGYAAAGTGPNMSGQGTLVEYLLLCLDTLCGHWMRAGERVPNPLSIVHQSLQPDIAQAFPPFPAFGFGEQLRVRGLTMTGAGLPTGALADEILLPGEGQVRALISLGANPASCIPDQLRMVEALRSLDLLVQVDIQMSPTAQLADYVIASPLLFEISGTNLMANFIGLYANGVGLPRPFAQYAPAVVDPPEGADVVEQWRLLFRIAQRMGKQIEFFPALGEVTSIAGAVGVPLDMTKDPDIDDLFEIVHSGSRIALDEVRQHPKGAIFDEPTVYVRPKEDGWTGRLDIGNESMMDDLTGVLVAGDDPPAEEFPFRLLSRRLLYVANSPGLALPANRPRHNPAFLNPTDLADLGLTDGDIVEIHSARAFIQAIVESDDTVRQGTVSLSHTWGGLPDTDEDVRAVGSNPGRLLVTDVDADRYSGQPKMSNIPVRIVVPQRAGAAAPP